jgi:hypothetical protein
MSMLKWANNVPQSLHTSKKTLDVVAESRVSFRVVPIFSTSSHCQRPACEVFACFLVTVLSSPSTPLYAICFGPSHVICTP